MKKLDGMIIAVDFDGTCVTHEFPNVGRDIGAVPVLKELVEEGAKLILWTIRSGKELADAVEWFSKNGITLWGVNKNPTQGSWSESPKAYAKLYIDDAAFGAPVLAPVLDIDAERPYIDWKIVREELLS